MVSFMTPTAAGNMLDLCYCIENAGVKLEKRISRVLFLARMYPGAVDTQMHDRIVSVVSNALDKSPQVEVAPTMKQLLTEISKPEGPVPEEASFPKTDPKAPFVPLLKKHFDGHCTKLLNADGDVYNIFCTLACKAITVLEFDPMASSLRKELLRKCKLVFKGGAAIGKFLFIGNPELWGSMNAMDRQFVLDNFVNGSDNDTSLIFDDSIRDYGFSDEEVNAEIGSIIQDMQLDLIKSSEAYEGLLQEYVQNVVGSTFTFAGEEFKIKARKAKHITIIDNGNNMNVVNIGNRRSHLHSSLEFKQFANPKGEMNKFFLARMKVGYRAVCTRNTSVFVNCFAECLDISAMCIDTAKLCPMTYQPLFRGE